MNLAKSGTELRSGNPALRAGMLAVGLFVTLGFCVASSCAQETPALKQSHFICDGEHPRCKVKDPSTYAYPQFGDRHVGEFAGVSDLLPPGKPMEHYQTFLSELISQRADTNAVALWGDATANADKTRVWGGFLSARSGFNGEKGADGQLIGLEIDVLNGGLPGVVPNASKVGLQIVGFGASNSNAIEVLSDSPTTGQWHNIINVQPGAVAEGGSIFGIAPQTAALGLNMLGSTFSDSAILISPKARISFRADNQFDAAIYRDDIDNGYLVLQAGPAGLRIANAENNKNFAIITPDGDIETPRGKLSNLYTRMDTLETELAAIKQQLKTR